MSSSFGVLDVYREPERDFSPSILKEEMQQMLEDRRTAYNTLLKMCP